MGFLLGDEPHQEPVKAFNSLNGIPGGFGVGDCGKLLLSTPLMGFGTVFHADGSKIILFQLPLWDSQWDSIPPPPGGGE